jgi:hypothetical protein
MKNEMKNPIRFLFFLTAMEGLLACFLTFNIPGEAKSTLLGGLSIQRFVLIAGIAIASIASLLLATEIPFFNNLRNRIFPFFEKRSGFLGLLTGFSLFFIHFPPILFSTIYKAQFHRLFYSAVWICLFCFQLLCMIVFVRIRKIGWSQYSKKCWGTVRPYIPWLISFGFPFLFMTPRLWVFGDHHYSVGNDFVPFSYYYKVYLLDYLVHFKLPFWSPSEAAGFPFLASPQTGALYPINIPIALYYWWKGSYGLIEHTWVTVLGISIYSVGLFAWLREFKWKETNALLASIIVSVSFQLTEIIRFTKGVESIAWLPWIMFCFTRILKEPSKKQFFWFYFGFAFSVFSFITAGYLYYQYYSIFLLIPIIVVLSINGARRKIGFEEWRFHFSDLIRPSISFVTPLFLLIPYFMHMFILLQQVYRRGARDYFYSTEHTFSWVDHLGSLVFPPIASPEGWYYFGILPLALVIYYFVTPRKKSRLDIVSGIENNWFLSKGVKLFLGFMIFLIITISFGKESFIFNTLWNYFPYFYAFRYWGRFTILLIPIIGFILTASIERIQSSLKNEVIEQTNIFSSTPIFKWIAIMVMITFLAIYAHSLPLNSQWDISFHLVASRYWFFYLSLILAIIFIASILVIIKKGLFSRRVASTIPVIFFALCMVDLWPIGAFQWPLDIIPEENPPGRLNIADEIIPQSFLYPRTLGKTNISITPKFSVGPSPDWFFKSYVEFYKKYSVENVARDTLLGREKNAQKLYLTSNIDYQKVEQFLIDGKQFTGTITVNKYDGEILDVQVESTLDGYLSFIDNWDPFWQVSVNGKPEKLDILFGTFKSVKIHPGISTVRFEYKPALFPISQLQKAMSEK